MDSHPKTLASEENMILTNLEEPRFVAAELNAHITVTLTCQDSKELINNVWRRRRFFNKYKKEELESINNWAPQMLQIATYYVLCHIVNFLKNYYFSPLSLSLLQLLILCSPGVLWLMRSLGCKSYISFPHSYQRSEFLKCRGQSPDMLEPPLTLLK